MKYSVGQKVKIKSLDWYNKNKDEYGIVVLSTRDFIPEMVEHCGTIVTIKDVFEDIDDNAVYYMEGIVWNWTDDMIEGLVEEETKPKFKVGDRIKRKGDTRLTTIKDIRDNYYIITIQDFFGNAYITDKLLFSNQNEYKIVPNKFDITTLKPFDKVLVRGDVGQKWTHDFFGFMDKDKGYPFVCVGNYVIQCIPYEGNEHLLGKTADCDEYFKTWNEPKDENGNIINTTKIVLEKKKKEVTYPKTYEECCEVLRKTKAYQSVSGYKTELLEDFQKLLICRDAYWKLAGEEMELGKPWEPSYDEECYDYVYYICYNSTGFGYSNTIRRILVFPTEEMRDAFYDNFKELINACKELL